MKSGIFSLILRLIIFTSALGVLQFIVVHFSISHERYYSTASIYSFHFILTLAACALLRFIGRHYNDKVGFTFMGLSLVKMLAGIVFLLPLLMNDTPYRFTDIILFFIPYFLFLIYEAIYAHRLIDQQDK